MANIRWRLVTGLVSLLATVILTFPAGAAVHLVADIWPNGAAVADIWPNGAPVAEIWPNGVLTGIATDASVVGVDSQGN